MATLCVGQPGSLSPFSVNHEDRCVAFCPERPCIVDRTRAGQTPCANSSSARPRRGVPQPSGRQPKFARVAAEACGVLTEQRGDATRRGCSAIGIRLPPAFAIYTGPEPNSSTVPLSIPAKLPTVPLSSPPDRPTVPLSSPPKRRTVPICTILVAFIRSPYVLHCRPARFKPRTPLVPRPVEHAAGMSAQGKKAAERRETLLGQLQHRHPGPAANRRIRRPEQSAAVMITDPLCLALGGRFGRPVTHSRRISVRGRTCHRTGERGSYNQAP
jgi:hypothetical protein